MSVAFSKLKLFAVPLREPSVRLCVVPVLLNEDNMNTTKKDSLVSQDPFFLAALKRLPDPLQVALRDNDIDDPCLLTAFPVLSVADLGLESTQGTARRRRIGKRKGPGDHEPQRYDVGDILGFTGPGPLGVTGPTTAGILGTIVSILIIIALVIPLFITSFLHLLSSSLQPFPGQRFLSFPPDHPGQVKTTPSLVGKASQQKGCSRARTTR